jgi:hypothetical protein
MNDTIHYLNTDLELASDEDLSALTAAFEAKGMWTLFVAAPGADGLWYANFEMRWDDKIWEPEPTIAAMLDVIESQTEPLQLVWSRCKVRDFNIGYDCGSEPWAFNQGLSNALLTRIVAAGASLRWTLYPSRPEPPGEPSATPICRDE